MARKILLADDSVTAQNMGRKILADAGYEVITVNNGSAALKKIAEQKPDLIVLDVYMPGYSGLEVCQRLKESQETARVPVLLTVGKLEPFKPEEAKRARADGFIVKPFEASELLSALSKLEDKIVPRAEASKPGRFARATAALDEGRYDKSVAIDEDSGWKNRIQFPSKNKAKPAQEDGDESEIYNAMNKDLRTVVENKIAHEPQAAQPEEARVDLGALAPEGLPNNVTPEEIAALAAAAAQVKGKIAQSRPAESAPVEIKPIETEKKWAEQGQVAPALAQEIPATAMPAAAFAEPKPEIVDSRASEPLETQLEKKIEAPKEATSTIVPSASDVMAAIAGLEVEAVSSSTNFEPSSGNGQRSQQPDSRDAQISTEHEAAASDRSDVPATMAVASGSDSTAAVRWTAVAVALSPDEAALSLELEMQKAYAAYAAADAGHGISAASSPEAQSLSAEAVAEISLPAAPASTDAVAAVPAIPAPEAAQGLTEMAVAATDAISAAVKELEAVAESYLAQKASAAAETEAARAEEPEPASPVATEAVSEAKSEASPVTPQPEARVEESPAAGQQTASEITQLNSPGASEVTSSEARITSAPYDPSLAVTAEMAIPDFGNLEHFAAGSSSSPTSPSPASGSAATSEPVSRDLTNDSDMAATTAAAWASWRQIRESGAPGSGTPGSGAQTTASSESEQQKSEESLSAPHDAAMAVAAGAETAPEGSTSEPESDSEGIANIVDSVLADLRPKIFEEISRKMGKKK